MAKSCFYVAVRQPFIVSPESDASHVQAIAMDEDAELAGLSDQLGPKAGAGAIPAGAMMASPGDQTQRKVHLERESETKQVLGRTMQEPPLLPHTQSGRSRAFRNCLSQKCNGIVLCRASHRPWAVCADTLQHTSNPKMKEEVHCIACNDLHRC